MDIFDHILSSSVMLINDSLFDSVAVWDKLAKVIVYNQLGDFRGLRILDFGSGSGVTSRYYAINNEVVSIDPCPEILHCDDKTMEDRDNINYKFILGDVSVLKNFANGYFDVVLCHNVLEYVDDREMVLSELCRVLRVDGLFSVLKHNRAGRVMQMAVLLDDFDRANRLLDGENSRADKYGEIRYFEDSLINDVCDNLVLVNSSGVRTFFDLQQNQEKHCDLEWQNKMIELELKVSCREEYMRIAFFRHLIYKKKL